MNSSKRIFNKKQNVYHSANRLFFFLMKNYSDKQKILFIFLLNWFSSFTLSCFLSKKFVELGSWQVFLLHNHNKSSKWRRCTMLIFKNFLLVMMLFFYVSFQTKFFLQFFLFFFSSPLFQNLFSGKRKVTEKMLILRKKKVCFLLKKFVDIPSFKC